MEFKLEDSVNHRIATLAILLKRQVFRIIAENKLDITPEQWVIMYYLWQQNNLTVGELASRSGKDFANVTRIVVKLQKAGYVMKCKSEKDSRSTVVRLLPKAEEIKDKIHQCWKQSSELALQGISQSEQTQLLTTIAKIETNILAKMELGWRSGNTRSPG